MILYNFVDTSVTSNGCWPGWTAISQNCYLTVVTTPLVRNNARTACVSWDWTGDVDLASIWDYYQWNEIKTLLVCTA